MEKKVLNSMPVLTQKALENYKEVFIVDKDYNLDGAKLIVPKRMTLNFEKGSLNNGTLVLDDSLLENMSACCIDARIEGTIQNNVIYTSHINGFNNLGLNDYSGKTIYGDRNDIINSTIILNNTSATTPTIFDGLGNTYTCNVTFFQIYGQSHVYIRNYNAIANSSNIVFEEMITSSVNVKNIRVYNNVINGFKLGISLNADSPNYTVSNCIVYNNVVLNCGGTTSGNGYGIHLANARNCVISDNDVENCERHAIYHAYGENNLIINNLIREHCKNITTYNLLAAVEIGRKSKNVIVKGNTFERCNNICLLVYSPLPSADSDGSTHTFRYGKCEGIIIENNTFNTGGLTGSIGNLPYVYIGVEGTSYSILSSNGTVVVDVAILGNTFHKISSENQKCIQIHQCERLTIAGNTFQLGLPASPQSSEYVVINIPTNYVSGYTTMMTIAHNTFEYSGSAVGKLYLMGANMSLFNTTTAPNYVIKWFGNTLSNQTIGGITRYLLSKNSPGNNFISYY